MVGACKSMRETPQQQYIETMDGFVDKVSDNYKNYTEQDWQEADSTFSNLLNNEESKQLSDSDRTHLNAAIAKYESLKIKQGIKSFKQTLKDGIEISKGIIDNLLSDSTDKN